MDNYNGEEVTKELHQYKSLCIQLAALEREFRSTIAFDCQFDAMLVHVDV